MNFPPKLTPLLFLLSLGSGAGLAQDLTIARQVLANAGGYHEASSFSISWTMGEAVTATLTGDQLILTQGFQQPDHEASTRVEEIPLKALGLQVFPNPAGMEVTIQTTRPEVLPLQLQVFDLSGRMVLHRRIADEKTVLDVHTLANGLYLLRFFDRENRPAIPLKLQKTSY